MLIALATGLCPAQAPAFDPKTPVNPHIGYSRSARHTSDQAKLP